jgi:hypothetical protein
MSITVTKKVLELDLPSTDKHVLTVFALHLNERHPDWGSWVGIPTLCEETGLESTAVKTSIARLKSRGHLKTIGHKTGVQARMPIRQVILQPSDQTCGVHSDETFGGENGRLAAENGRLATPDETRGYPNQGFNKYEQEKNKEILASFPETGGHELLIHLATLGLNLLPKQQMVVSQVAEQYPFSILRRAADACLTGLTIGNTYDHCEEKIAANLGLQCQVILKADDDARKTREMVQRCMRREQEKAAEELAGAERERAEEEAGIEESLPDESALAVCAENGY